MKKISYIALSAFIMAGLTLASCSKDDDPTPEDNQEQQGPDNQNNQNNQNNQDNPENNTPKGPLAEFYAKLPMSKYSVTKDNVLTSYDKFYDEFKALVPVGIYLLTDDSGDQFVLGKGNDGSIIVYSKDDLEAECSFTGSSLYTTSYGDDGKNCAYMFYNDKFGQANNYKPAPSLCKYEYESREDLLKLTHHKDACKIAKIHDAITTFFVPWFYSQYGDDNFALHSEGKTELNGIECNYYYVTYEGDGSWIMADGAPEKVQEWWVTDDFICLQHYTYEALGGDTWCKLDSYISFSGNFEQLYKKINKEFSVHGEVALADALSSHKKWGNYWPTGEYPESLNQWLIKYEDNITAFEIGRRAWVGYDNICSITIECDEATADEIKAYIAKVKALNFPDVYEDSQLELEKFKQLTPEQREQLGITDEMMENLEKMNTTSISYRAAYEEIGDLGLGKTGIYPSYDIIFSDVVAGFKTVRIVFDLVRLTGV